MKADRIFGVVICTLALAFILLAVPAIEDDGQHDSAPAYYTVGPRLFPYLAGALMLAFGLLVVARPQDELPNMPNWQGAGAPRRVLLLGLLVLGYVAGLPLLGFTVTSVTVLLLFLLLFGERRWSVIAPMALLGPIFVEFLFLSGFGRRLPGGFFKLSVF